MRALIYAAGTIRLDEFDGEFEVDFVKSVPGVTWLDLGAGPALWLPKPHAVESRRDDATTR